MNGLASTLLGFYLFLVVISGQSEKLIELIKRDYSFGKWLIAIVLLWQVRKAFSSNPAIDGIISVAMVALILNLGDEFFNKIGKFFEDK